MPIQKNSSLKLKAVVTKVVKTLTISISKKILTKSPKSIRDSSMLRKETAKIWTSLMKLILLSLKQGNASRNIEVSSL